MPAVLLVERGAEAYRRRDGAETEQDEDRRADAARDARESGDDAELQT
jgi:hypothetical protein